MPSRQPPSPTALSAARSLMAELEAGRLVSELAAEGVDALLIKGPATEGWLYDADEVRSIGDIDLVVAPDHYRRAEAVLSRAGFVSRYDGASPATSEAHADTWVSGRRPFPIDLHRRLWGFTAPPPHVWRVIWRSREPLRSAVDSGVVVPAIAVRALMVALHAAHHETAAKPLEDLRRAIERVPDATWAEARELAAELGAVGGLAAGLRLNPAGGSLAARLSLPEDARLVRPPAPASWGGPPTADGFNRLAALPRPERARVLGRELFPSAAFMRERSVVAPLARRGPIGLAASYPVRWARLARHVPAGWRFARRGPR